MKWKKIPDLLYPFTCWAGGSVQYTVLALNKCWMCVCIFSDNVIVIILQTKSVKRRFCHNNKKRPCIPMWCVFKWIRKVLRMVAAKNWRRKWSIELFRVLCDSKINTGKNRMSPFDFFVARVNNTRTRNYRFKLWVPKEIENE